MIKGENCLNSMQCRVKWCVPRSFEKSFLSTVVQLFDIEGVPSIENKVLYALYVLVYLK